MLSTKLIFPVVESKFAQKTIFLVTFSLPWASELTERLSTVKALSISISGVLGMASSFTVFTAIWVYILLRLALLSLDDPTSYSAVIVLPTGYGSPSISTIVKVLPVFLKASESSFERAPLQLIDDEFLVF